MGNSVYLHAYAGVCFCVNMLTRVLCKHKKERKHMVDRLLRSRYLRYLDGVARLPQHGSSIKRKSAHSSISLTVMNKNMLWEMEL